MKKDRNSFFSQYGVTGFNTTNQMMPNMNQMIPNYNETPYPTPYPYTNNYNEPQYSNLESRISKLERDNKVLEQRITSLENQIPIHDYNSMYMV